VFSLGAHGTGSRCCVNKGSEATGVSTGSAAALIDGAGVRERELLQPTVATPTEMASTIVCVMGIAFRQLQSIGHT
jgi:hypothetical protein